VFDIINVEMFFDESFIYFEHDWEEAYWSMLFRLCGDGIAR